MPLFWFTEPKLGGFGFSPMQISIFLCIVGGAQALWILAAFPLLQHRFGTGGVLRICAVSWPIMFAICPLCNLFMRHNWNVAFWIVAPANLVIGSGVSMAFSKSFPQPSLINSNCGALYFQLLSNWLSTISHLRTRHSVL